MIDPLGPPGVCGQEAPEPGGEASSSLAINELVGMASADGAIPSTRPLDGLQRPPSISLGPRWRRRGARLPRVPLSELLT